jgi:hypothetical protein
MSQLVLCALLSVSLPVLLRDFCVWSGGVVLHLFGRGFSQPCVSVAWSASREEEIYLNAVFVW